MRETAASIRVVVFPVPVAPVIIKGVPRWAAASSCAALRVREAAAESALTRRSCGLLTVRIQPYGSDNGRD